MSLPALLTGVICEIFLWQSGVQIANVTSAAQTIQGIGASGAWWPLDLYNYPDSVRTNVSDLLFSNQTLGLTSYRYNIGGGGVNVGNPSRAPESSYVSAGTYNFSSDPQGTYWLREAARYNVPILTAFVNSAPPAFTSNGESCGGQLVDAQIPAYATYLAQILAWWKTQDVVFTHVSPMNEPDNAFGYANGAPCGQEGMIVNVTQRAPLVAALRSALDTAGLQSVQVLADESASTLNFAVEYTSWLPSAASSLGAVSHHDYLFGDDPTVALMGSEARNASGKETWFTEICCYVGVNGSTGDPAATLVYGANYDPTILSALQLGNLLYQSFTQTLDAHFDWWTALSSSLGCDPSTSSTCVGSINGVGYNDGLIYYDPNYATNGNYALYLTKRYHVLRHFAHAIPLGSVRYNVATPTANANLRVLIFSTGASSWSTIVMNLGSTTAPFALDTLTMGSATAAYQTSAQGDYSPVSLEDTMTCGTIFQVTVPAESIISVYFSA